MLPVLPTVSPEALESIVMPEVLTAWSKEVNEEPLLAGCITTFPLVFTVVDEVPLFGT